MALAAGLRPAAYLRAAGLNKSISWRFNAAATCELRRIGVNLNQLARAANREGAIVEKKKLTVLTNELKKIMAEL